MGDVRGCSDFETTFPALGGAHLYKDSGCMRSKGALFLCLNQERPCPGVSVARVPGLNSVGESCGECCHAIKRARKAADRTDATIANNYYLRYCSGMPMPFEAVVEWIVQRWNQPKPPASPGLSQDDEGA